MNLHSPATDSVTVPRPAGEVPQHEVAAPHPRLARWRPALVTAATCAAWVGLALRSPGVTYHVAPLIAAGAGPALTRGVFARDRKRLLLAIGFASTALVAVVGALLAATGHLEGPTLWHSRPATSEALGFALLGGAWGTRVAMRQRAGVVGRLVS